MKDPWLESRPSSTLFCLIGDPDVIGPLPTSMVSQGNSCSKHNIHVPDRTLCITPATSDSASGQYVDDTILAGVVNKNPKICMTELCRLG